MKHMEAAAASVADLSANAGEKTPRLLWAAVGLGAAALTYLGDEMITRWTWREQLPEIISYEDELSGMPVPERWLIVPGHGQHDPTPLMQRMKEGVLRDEPVSGLRYAASGFNVRHIGEQLYAFGKTTKVMHVLGNSLGSLTTLKALASLPEEMRAALPPIGNFVLNSSPYELQDTYDERLAKIITRAPYRGSVLGKLILGSLSRIREEKHTIPTAVQGSLDVLFDVVSPRTWMGHLEFLVGTERDGIGNHVDELRNIMVSGVTRVLFAHPDEKEGDRMVRCDRALENWSAFFAKFDIAVEQLRMPGAGHADMGRLSVELGPWLDKTTPDDNRPVLHAAT